MKCLGCLLLIATCLATVGCSSITRSIQTHYFVQRDLAWSQGVAMNREPGSFQVYNAEPCTIHLEFEETDLQQEGAEQLHGDGGASLNAYAACLTLKVIF